jgi:hypothetical protein
LYQCPPQKRLKIIKQMFQILRQSLGLLFGIGVLLKPIRILIVFQYRHPGGLDPPIIYHIEVNPSEPFMCLYLLTILLFILGEKNYIAAPQSIFDFRVLLFPDQVLCPQAEKSWKLYNACADLLINSNRLAIIERRVSNLFYKSQKFTQPASRTIGSLAPTSQLTSRSRFSCCL